MIKFWSYKRELNRYKGKLNSQINKSLKSGNIFFGEQLSSFEKKFIKKNKSKYGIAVGSGTDALLIALTALGIKKGDQVNILFISDGESSRFEELNEECNNLIIKREKNACYFSDE